MAGETPCRANEGVTILLLEHQGKMKRKRGCDKGKLVIRLFERNFLDFLRYLQMSRNRWSINIERKLLLKAIW